MEVHAVLMNCGGVARRATLASLGVDDAALRRAVRRDVLQPARGVYALPGTSVAQIGLVTGRRLLTCVSAAAAYSLWTLSASNDRPERLHVHHRRSDAVPDAVPHHGLVLAPHPYRPMASLADVLIHGLRCRPWQESLVMVESAVIRGDMTVEFLRRHLPGRRNGRAREVLRWVDRGSESLLETLTRTHFRKAGLNVQPQAYIDGVGYVDLLVEGWLVVELDGRHHAEWRRVKKDHRRNNASIIEGYTVLRYYYEDVVHGPEQMVAQVMAVLGAGPGRRPAGL